MRTRLKTGVFQDATAVIARVNVKGAQKEKRFPLDAPMAEIDRWRAQTARLLGLRPPAPTRGSLGRDAETYYTAVKDLASFIARRAEIRAWIWALGPTMRRSQITGIDVRRVRGDWLKDNVAPKTINNRVFALQHLYKTLDGREYPTPCDDVKPLPVHRRPAIRIPDAIARQIESTMRDKERTGRLKDAKTRARFMVFVSTGHRPSEIGRAQREDVDLERRVWIPRDGKGGFCPGVYLNDDMLAAWQAFINADAFGWFDSGSFARRIYSSGLPRHFTPYQFRHTVGLVLSEAGVDMRDISDHFGHKHSETTRKHYVPVISSRLERVSRVLDSRKLGWKK